MEVETIFASYSLNLRGITPALGCKARSGRESSFPSPGRLVVRSQTDQR